MVNAIAIAALVIGSVALLLSCVGVALVVGLKNSTHQVVWKQVEPKAEEEDDFSDAFVDQEFNPNKRIKKEEPFVDLEDPQKQQTIGKETPWPIT